MMLALELAPRTLGRLQHLGALVAGSATLLLATAGPAHAQCDGQRMLVDDPQFVQRLGGAVGLSGERAVVGARGDSDIDTAAGSVYAFERTGSTWNQTQELHASDGAFDARFGSSLRILGNRLLVGSPNADGVGADSGAAYLFEHDGTSWSETAVLIPSDSQAGDLFGTDVYLWSDLAFVGAPGDDAVAADAGSVYVFQDNGTSWVQVGLITGSDSAMEDAFGTEIAADDDTLVVGASRDDDRGSDTGTVFVFERVAGAWNEVTKFHSPQPTPDDQFGSALSISADTILIGCSNESHGGFATGAAYAFERDTNGWGPATLLLANDGLPFDQYGSAVDLHGDQAIIGAFYVEVAGTPNGAAYLFERQAGVWIQTNKLHSGDENGDDRFGTSVAVNDTDALVGAMFHDGPLIDGGAAYAYELDAGVTSNYCIGGTNSLGTSAALFMTGTPTVSNDDMGLFVTGAVPDKPGVFFYGPDQMQVPFGEGWRCVGGPLTRLPQVVTTDIFGSASIAVDFSAPPVGGGGSSAIVAGSDWNFQYWYRDPAGGPSGVNLSDGLSVAFCP